MSVSTSQNAYIDSLASAKAASSGLPFIAGKWFFVDPKDGSSSNDGLTISTPFASLSTAYTACTDGAGDGIAIISRGTTTAHTTSYLAATITWSKAGITVFGICAPSRFAQRARISTAAANLANLISVTGNNNSFYNLSFYNAGTTGAGGVLVSGARNYFKNVHFVGGNGMTTPTITDYSLKLSNASECDFVDCAIGTDTFNKGDIAGTQLMISGDAATGGCSRIRFTHCELLAYSTAGTTNGLIKLTSEDCLTRMIIFERCFFHMYRNGAVTSEASVVISAYTLSNGSIVFWDCQRHGFTDWAPVANLVYSASTTGAEAGGITVICNPS